MLFKDASEMFITFLKKQKKASATILAYRSDVGQLINFLSGKGLTNVNSVNSDLLNEFKADLEKNGYISKSISRKINSVKTFFKYLKT